MPSKRLLHAALLSSATFLIAVPALATPFTVGAGVTDTAVKSVQDNDAGTVAATGSLSTSDTGSAAATWNGGAAGTTTTIDNSGTIKSTGARAIESAKVSAGSMTITNETGASIISTAKDAIQFQSKKNTTLNGSVTITNDGLIEAQGVGDVNGQAIDLNDLLVNPGKLTVVNKVNGTISAADSDAIRGGNNTEIDNYGVIASHYSTTDNLNGNDSGNDAIDFHDDTLAGTVNNYQTGSIIGARHGITAKQPLAITNDGAITGLDGSGINLDTAGDTTTHITNYSHGVITGTLVTSDGDGVDVDGQVAIENYGQIKSVGQGGGNLSEGLAIGGGTVNNYAGGLIEGADRAITVDDSNLSNEFGATTIYNEGTIKGDTGDAIKITACQNAVNCFSNTLTNKGAIIGNVALGDGDDTLNLMHGSSIAGTVDGQGGNDAVHLADAGTVSDIVNFETLSADSGSSTLKGNQTYTDGATVKNGATLGLDGATLNADTGVNSGGKLAVTGAGGTVNGDVTNNGEVHVTGAPATFNGTFTNNGMFVSDPTTMHFGTFDQGANGIVKAAPGDIYQVTGDFLNHSTQNGEWDTTGAILEFTGGGSHEMLVNGSDFGPGPSGFADNFAWRELKIDDGDTLELAGLDGDSVFYAGAVVGAKILGGLIENITGNGLDIYYDASAAANAYLAGLTYDLVGGGQLIAAYAPEPATLFLAAPAVLLLSRRRKRGSR